MRRITYLLLFGFLLTSCGEGDSSEQNSELDNEIIDSVDHSTLFMSDIWSADIEDDSVLIQLSINQKDKSIDCKLDLFGGAWIVSPLATDYPYGKMELSLEENEFASLSLDIQQTPVAEIVSDHNVPEPYEIIRNSSLISQKVKIKSTEDFETKGSLFYLLEPICLPYRIDFVLKSKQGELFIDQEQVRALPIVA